MKICGDVMTSDPFCCLVQDNSVKAAQLMKEQNVGSIPVVEDVTSRKLIGIVTDRDLALHVVAQNLNPSEVRVGDAMSRDLIVCHKEDSISTAIEAMAVNQVRRIPIVDQDNRIVGIIAQKDLALRLRDSETTGQLVAEISE